MNADRKARTTRSQRVLVTGAGGAAAIAFYKAVSHLDDVIVHMADMDTHSSGLYLLPPDRRSLLPPGRSPEFAEALLHQCERRGIDVVVPTVDCELGPLETMRPRFEATGVGLALSPGHALATCYDKHRLMAELDGCVKLAGYGLYDESFKPVTADYPFIIKPRIGAGARGVKLVRCYSDLNGTPRNGKFMVQEYLPGAEYSVDVYVASGDRVIASVVRERMRVYSGVAVTSRTVFDPEISALAADIAGRVGIRYAANVQFRRDSAGRPRLLEINPRFPGTMSLTVAAGVNMPELCLREMRGETLPDHIDYAPLAMVRHWEETFLCPSELMNAPAPAAAAA